MRNYFKLVIKSAYSLQLVNKDGENPIPAKYVLLQEKPNIRLHVHFHSQPFTMFNRIIDKQIAFLLTAMRYF